MRRLRLARSLRDLGLALDEVGEIVAVAHDGTCGELRGALAGTLGETIAGIGRLFGVSRQRVSAYLQEHQQLLERCADRQDRPEA